MLIFLSFTSMLMAENNKYRYLKILNKNGALGGILYQKKKLCQTPHKVKSNIGRAILTIK